LLERNLDRTAATLKMLGFEPVATDGSRTRFVSSAGTSLGNHIDVVVDPKAGYGHPGAGSVHHIAYRAKDDTAQLAWLDEIGKHLQVTPVQDRTYFHSIYFREPGGVLFELATDPPGFGLDEPAETLGEALRIPSWFEPHRASIEARLLPIELHQSSKSAKKEVTA